MEPVSLESPIGEEDDSHLGDFVEDKDNETPTDFVRKSILHDQLRENMNSSHHVKKKSYGFVMGLMMINHGRLKRSGKSLALPVNGFRQIEAKAIKKLRHPSRTKGLRGHDS